MNVQSLFHALARYRLHLSFLFFVAVVLEWQLNDGGRPHPLWPPRDIEHPLGMLLIVAGLLLRSWAAGVIAKRTVLAVGGPYALLRHPLYAGSFLIGLGLAEVMEDRLALAAVAILTVAVYVPTVRREERQLAERFGAAWNDYVRRTEAILPSIPLRFSPGNWSQERWWRNREWRVLFRTAVILLLLEWWNAEG